MSCDSITVEYPSVRLLPLVNAAIAHQMCELALIRKDHDDKILEYSQMSWFKKLNNFHPNDNHYGNSHWFNYTNHMQNLKESIWDLKKILLAAESVDTVRLTGDCLSRIDELAGN